MLSINLRKLFLRRRKKFQRSKCLYFAKYLKFIRFKNIVKYSQYKYHPRVRNTNNSIVRNDSSLYNYRTHSYNLAKSFYSKFSSICNPNIVSIVSSLFYHIYISMRKLSNNIPSEQLEPFFNKLTSVYSLMHTYVYNESKYSMDIALTPIRIYPERAVYSKIYEFAFCDSYLQIFLDDNVHVTELPLFNYISLHKFNFLYNLYRDNNSISINNNNRRLKSIFFLYIIRHALPTYHSYYIMDSYNNSYRFNSIKKHILSKFERYILESDVLDSLFCSNLVNRTYFSQTRRRKQKK